MPNRIQINGLDIEAPDGANISVVNGKVTIDGKPYGSCGTGKIVIETQAAFQLTCDQNVEVRGDVKYGVTAKGNVAANNITGGVEAGGDITATNITGGINAQGNVVCKGNITGGVNARSISQGR